MDVTSMGHAVALTIVVFVTVLVKPAVRKNAQQDVKCLAYAYVQRIAQKAVTQKALNAAIQSV